MFICDVDTMVVATGSIWKHKNDCEISHRSTVRLWLVTLTGGAL